MQQQRIFDASWYVVKIHLESKKRFVGVIETLFPGITQVKSDFSIVKFTKDNFQISLTELLLKDILHSNQYAMLALL